jgi:hypothetical protein
MTPVLQTVLGYPGGNCFQACLASVLDLPLKNVPHLFRHVTEENDRWNQELWDRLREFARKRGYRAVWAYPQEHPDETRQLIESGLYYIATGRSPAGDWGHSVVMRAGEYVFDPAGGRQYLDGEPWLLIAFLRSYADE